MLHGKKMTKKRILAFGHRSRTGKDTAANIALQYFRINHPELRISRLSFAWKVKEISFQLYGWAGLHEPSYYDLHEAAREDVLVALGGRTPVEIWIEVGMAMRGVYDDVWAQFVVHDDCDVLIIPDLRFHNEVKLIRGYDSKIVKVIRDVPKRDSVADNALEDFNDWDLVLDNNKSLRNLHEEVYEICKTM
jgi:hypothetical protein